MDRVGLVQHHQNYVDAFGASALVAGSTVHDSLLCVQASVLWPISQGDTGPTIRRCLLMLDVRTSSRNARARNVPGAARVM
jgi:hypothetical protein